MGMIDLRTREGILARLEAMRTRPQMYATTIEGFLMQVWIYLELLGVDHSVQRSWAIDLYGNGSDRMPDLLTIPEAHRMIDSAFATLVKD